MFLTKITLSLMIVLNVTCNGAKFSHTRLWRTDHLKQKAKSHSKVSPELSDLENMSPSQLRKLLQEITEQRKNVGCDDSFRSPEQKIIQTRNSIENGAKFLGVKGIEDADECMTTCCSYNIEDNDYGCDLALFHYPRCFLFKCYNETTNEYQCLFTNHTDYWSYSRIRHAIKENEVEQLNEETEEMESQSVDNDSEEADLVTTTEVLLATDNIEPALNLAENYESSATTTTAATEHDKITHAPNKAMSLCNTKCTRFEWQCDNLCCIPVHYVCNGVAHCSDGSDEQGCPSYILRQHLEANLNELENPDSTAQDKGAESKATSSVKVDPDVKPPTKAEKSMLNQTETVFEVHAVNESVVNTLVENIEQSDTGKEIVVVEDNETIHEEQGAVLPLAIGLAVTASVLLMVACRVRAMKSKLRRKGRPLTMDESDYLINGMYL
ncbi:low-density lipoprotein receptor-related protein 11-like [Clavelina lepadiformis]|uniref:low-density lipoprotein receptor-related protein 11-like n=1 Tax=Clavelina lepadiformis TaxID=159417 RepID=UPI004041C131